jgi:hypothetical protein
MDISNPRTGIASDLILLSEATSRAVLEVLLPDLGDLYQHGRALDLRDVLEAVSWSVTESFGWMKREEEETKEADGRLSTSSRSKKRWIETTDEHRSQFDRT